MATVRVAQVAAQGPPPFVGSTVRVGLLSAQGAPLVSVNAYAGQDTATQSFRDTTLDGSESTGPITLWSWAQVPNGSPTVSLVGSGASRSYQAPARSTAYALLFDLTVTDGITNSTDRVQHTVLPWTEWILIGSTWTAYASTILDTS